MTSDTELVWAKLAGYPWWPAKLVDEATLPEDVKKHKHTDAAVPVFFFGSRDYGWFTKGSLKDFDSNFEQFSKKSNQKLFLQALKEAKNPLLLETPMVVESEEEKKKKANRKRNRVSEALPEKSTTSTTRKRRKSAPAVENAGSIAEKENQVERSPKDQLLRLRMKLQKFLQQETERTASDFEKASIYLTEVENFEVTYTLLKETKIGKVVRKLASLEFENDEQRITERCKEVLTRWKAMLPLSAEEEKANTQEEVPQSVNEDSKEETEAKLEVETNESVAPTESESIAAPELTEETIHSMETPAMVEQAH